MADKRAYFRMDVGYLQNPKVAPLVESNPRAVLLHLQAIAYSAQHLTDGTVPRRLVMALAGVEPCSEGCPMHCVGECPVQCTVENGLLSTPDSTSLRVHDYLEHQRSRQETQAASDKGKRAAAARWDDASSNASSIPAGNAKREREKELPVEDAPRPDVESLCNLLAELMIDNGNKPPTITKAWRNAARLLLDKDGRPIDEAVDLIRWSQGDHFWRSNIMSMPTFREQYDKLRLRSGMSRHTPTTGQPSIEEWS